MQSFGTQLLLVVAVCTNRLLLRSTLAAADETGARGRHHAASPLSTDLLRLGSACSASVQCLLRIPHSRCSGGRCDCLPHHSPYNDTTCLPASLLGYACATSGQCRVKVPHSECSPETHLCQCAEGFLPLRKDKCLPPAHLGEYCLSDAQCHLADKLSRCQYIVPRVYGKCECPWAVENGLCVTRGVSNFSSPSVRSLGKSCVHSGQCRVRDPNSRCVRGRCECVRDTPYCSANNTRCLPDTFQCASGQCISWYFVCDGERNCADGSDEHDCTPFACPSEAFQCNDGTCLSRSAVCNGRWECPDGSDEATCYTGIPCDPRAFRCSDGQCLPPYVLCNALVECADGSDERFDACHTGEGGCPEGSFRCGNGRCRSTAIVCSGLDGCGDNSDEDGCSVCLCAAPE